eukprot:Protomagalhaensia_sp_Gyna_25__3955@NODE_3562_length_534_cov_4_814141_g3007_i0_p1_GENE_NODE_3562_length_534_cov_4_814141_g3007_i0NODE_3562_length_534_cov_4_814141_g3007_i0_p1_ORF_typecomplete_len138_score11_99_NODE_3562_length_534_cov_4_814141_g3007_i0114527
MGVCHTLVSSDAARAVMALAGVLRNLQASLKEVEAREPLLATRQSSETTTLPSFERAFTRTPGSLVGLSCSTLTRNGFGVCCMQCAFHKAAILLAVDPSGRASIARATRMLDSSDSARATRMLDSSDNKTKQNTTKS